ncbi:hypothetical protein N0V90_006999 [Kalmusia sp. IMI 367209]|nr:hypothetical protein N0V90_006999 [Kalmusia sp. IMI 367209]
MIAASSAVSQHGDSDKENEDPVINQLDPREVAIVYNHGSSIEKMNKYFLCDISRYFANAFNGNFKESHSRVIRLRNDFPWAVYAMLKFLKSGSYYMYPRLLVEYPYITMLDLHVHCYILADKYDLVALGNYAMTGYLRIAGDVLSLDWASDDPKYIYEPNSGACYRYFSIYEDIPSRDDDSPLVKYRPDDMCAAAEVDRFLCSIVLLWMSTPSGNDVLRKAALEMIKPCLVKLMRLKHFKMLFNVLEDFEKDLAMSLCDDGFGVLIKPYLGVPISDGVAFA